MPQESQEERARRPVQAPLSTTWTRYTDPARRAAEEGRLEAETGYTASQGQQALGLGAAQMAQRQAAVRGGALGARGGVYGAGQMAGDVTQRAAIGRAQEVAAARQAYIDQQQSIADAWVAHETRAAGISGAATTEERQWAEWQRRRQEDLAARNRAAVGEALGHMAGAASDEGLKSGMGRASAAEQDATIAALQRRIAQLEAGGGGIHG